MRSGRFVMLRPSLAALAVAVLAACSSQSQPAAAAVKPAAAPVPAKPPARPAQAAVAADGQRVDVVTAIREFPIEIADVFDGRVRKIDRVTILGQEDKGERFDLLLRIEGASDPKAEGGRCRDGREVVLRTLAFDGNDNQVSGSHDLESCLKRTRLVAERRQGDRVEYDLEHTYAEGDTWPVYLVYDLRHPGADITL
ncbi:hypothetical protein K4L06_00825 [Lysobacter sp. BMK333-48F3]|uniref:hypothetical protein n=1 Tax=Lysobacter sp. BMK333-48F3 TaxID=2867962 RepID=UPI001C8B3B46|nr:hypothetical protein [Lysobacter sp. BMK333-48F3]MBX9399836.1 hypothetical protein [Lysobacter sp. BMK333-48F3]